MVHEMRRRPAGDTIFHKPLAHPEELQFNYFQYVAKAAVDQLPLIPPQHTVQDGDTGWATTLTRVFQRCRVQTLPLNPIG